MNIEWNTDNTVSLIPVPKRPRKLTGTRFASALGYNAWSTPFQTWCEITGAYRKPFEETKYTAAGKAIEPKQIEFTRSEWLFSDLIDPTMEYGENFFDKTHGNFFNDRVFGGMWDAIRRDEDGNVTMVLECKTTKRVQDWEDDIPEYYALQAALYAWLLDCDQVMMVVSFLQDDDYEHPEDFVCTDDNTAFIDFKVSERYPTFYNDYIEPAREWYDEYVYGGVSPEFDENKDAEYLTPMRNASLNPASDVDALLNELAALQHDIDAVESAIKDKTKRVKNIKSQLKALCQENIGDNKTATLKNDKVTCTLTRNTNRVVDEDALKWDGLFEDYSNEVVSDRFTVKFAK